MCTENETGPAKEASMAWPAQKGWKSAVNHVIHALSLHVADG